MSQCKSGKHEEEDKSQMMMKFPKLDYPVSVKLSAELIEVYLNLEVI